MITKSSLATGRVLAGSFWAVVFLFAVPQSSIAAEPPELVKLYGNGVHAYFAHNHTEAFNLLSHAIAAGTRDPRAYYFRGMALLRMGREFEAKSDMEIGAAIEAQDPNAYPVSRSLERIQGRGRRMLEKYRRQAKFAMMQQQQAVQQLRFEATERRESSVLRQQVQFGVEHLLPSQGATPPVVETPAVPSDDSAVAQPPDVASDVKPSGDAEPDLFGEKAPEDMPAEEPGDTPSSDDDPFGEEVADDSNPADAAAPVTNDVAAREDESGIQVEKKVKARKLIGILGGILGRTVKGAMPTPSLPPGIPGAGPPGGPPNLGDDDPFGAGEGAPPADEDVPLGAMPDGENASDDPFTDDLTEDDGTPTDDGFAEEPPADDPPADDPPSDETPSNGEPEEDAGGDEDDDPFDLG